MKRLLRIGTLVAAFILASGATYVAVDRWNAVKNKPVNTAATHGDTLEGVSGLNEGDVVTLPQLTNLAGGEIVNLAELRKDRLLCVFISNRCPGCTRDADLWRELHKEAANRDAAFYLINIGDDRPQIEQFVASYNLQQLSVLFDPSHRIGPQLKVGFLPQYILFDQSGRVIGRWDGVRNYEKNGGTEQLAEFFQPH